MPDTPECYRASTRQPKPHAQTSASEAAHVEEAHTAGRHEARQSTWTPRTFVGRQPPIDPLD